MIKKLFSALLLGALIVLLAVACKHKVGLEYEYPQSVRYLQTHKGVDTIPSLDELIEEAQHWDTMLHQWDDFGTSYGALLKQNGLPATTKGLRRVIDEEYPDIWEEQEQLLRVSANSFLSPRGEED